MNKKIAGIIAGSLLLLNPLSRNVFSLEQTSLSEESVKNSVTIDSVIENVDYPRSRDIKNIISYFNLFCKAYDTTEGSEEEKIKSGVDYAASLDGASDFSKSVKKAYEFNEDTRKSVKSYIYYFLEEHKKPESDLEGWVEYFYESYNEIGEESRNIQRKYLNAISAEKQKDMADLKLICEYANVHLDPLIRLERAIERANRRLQKSIVDDILELHERIIQEKIIPTLNISEVAKYLLIKNFKEVGEETYRQWMTEVYNASALSKEVYKTPDNFIKMYDDFYKRMGEYLEKDPKKFLSHLLPEK